MNHAFIQIQHIGINMTIINIVLLVIFTIILVAIAATLGIKKTLEIVFLSGCLVISLFSKDRATKVADWGHGKYFGKNHDA